MTEEIRSMNSLKLLRSRCATAIIETEWTSSEMKLNLLLPSDSAKVLGFSGALSLSKLQEIANDLEQPWPEFFDETKLALCTENGAPNFEYEHNEVKSTFTWRRVDENRYKIDIKLTPNDELCFVLLRNSMQVISSLNVSKQSIENELDTWKERYRVLQAAFEEQTEEKRKIENDYLSKFLALMNELKIKNRKLKGKPIPVYADSSPATHSNDNGEVTMMNHTKPVTSSFGNTTIGLRKRNALPTSTITSDRLVKTTKLSTTLLSSSSLIPDAQKSPSQPSVTPLSGLPDVVAGPSSVPSTSAEQQSKEASFKVADPEEQNEVINTPPDPPSSDTYDALRALYAELDAIVEMNRSPAREPEENNIYDCNTQVLPRK